MGPVGGGHPYRMGMRVVITGATGNVGSALLRRLEGDPAVDEIVGVVRRPPPLAFPKVTWAPADVASDDLVPLFRGADAVVHLAFLIQPSRRPALLRAVNVDGARRVFTAAAGAGVRTLVHASSVGAYSAGPKDRAVDETWPANGVPTSFYARHKAANERDLDRLQAEHPEMRIVRLRPGVILQSQAASEIARLFAGPLLPMSFLRPGWIAVVPDVTGLRVQVVHADDVADAYARALDSDARGAFNIAADPVLDAPTLAEALRARTLAAPRSALRLLAALTWRAHLQPTPPGWLDMALAVPIMDCSRAGRELGWQAEHSSVETVVELLRAMAGHRSGLTPPLAAGHRVGASTSPTPG